MLKRIPSGSDVAAPSAKMFEAAEMLVSAVKRNCARDWSRPKPGLSAARRAFEESVEALKRSQDDNEALRIELAEAKSREEATDARLLELRLSAQKEELEAEFTAQREELETDYQKQVDEMYFFGYRYCMKKHGIKRDVPSIPPGEEEKLRRKPSQ
ncbi:hypothetical protein CK203_044049 [Vitis vinifera]|uniref:Uncharacterized protein n=1 Tax=Vitis vinifera TaxID=29760 RepID=A0A438HLV0_VITVI|nr:hypothetical protein CK203_044049 [Vitis vinifera]